MIYSTIFGKGGFHDKIKVPQNWVDDLHGVVIVRNEEILGRGVYTVGEAASYVGIDSDKVRRWFTTKVNSRDGKAFRSDYSSVENRYAISFLDLVDVYVANLLCQQDLTVRLVKKAFVHMQTHWNCLHPFATYRLYSGGGEIIARAADDLKEQRLAEVFSKQQFFPDIIRPHLNVIEYDSQKALRWAIAQGIVLDPTRSFGKPVIRMEDRITRITSRTVARTYFANGKNALLVADLYDLREQDVKNAVMFEKERGLVVAA